MTNPVKYPIILDISNLTANLRSDVANGDQPSQQLHLKWKVSSIVQYRGAPTERHYVTYRLEVDEDRDKWVYYDDLKPEPEVVDAPRSQSVCLYSFL